MAMEAELRAQLVRAVAVVRERRAALSEARRVRRNALERQRYDNRTAPARVARARAALPNFAPRNPRYNSTRMSTGGAAPRRRFDAEFHRAQLRIASVELESALDEVTYLRARLAAVVALARE